MLKVFWKWLNHGIQSCQWKHLLFSLPQGNIFKKKKRKKKYSIWVLIFLLFSNQNIQSMRREQEKKVVPELRNPVSSTRLCWFLTQLTQSCCLGIAHLSVMPAGDGCRRWPGRDKGCTEVSFPQHLTQPEHRLKALRGFQPSSLETKQAGKVEKGKKRKAGVGGKYYIPNWIAWNFLTHVWKNQITSIKAALLWHQHPLCCWGGSSLTACPEITGTGHRISVWSQPGAGREVHEQPWAALWREVALHEAWGEGSGTEVCKNLCLSI